MIEDSIPAADQITGYLTELGFATSTLLRGEGALAEVRRFKPDLIILDLLLPGLNGWKVLSQLKAEPDLAAIPVLVVSVIDEPVAALAAGASGHILKPITRAALRKALDRLEQARTAGAKSQPAAVPPKARVLMAEDNEANIEAVGGYLEDIGYQVTVARNGREALERVTEARPDVVLMDIQMPEMDGLHAVRRLRQIPGLETIPIIALTALAMPGDEDRCLAAGVNAYLTKPVSLRKLVETMRQFV